MPPRGWKRTVLGLHYLDQRGRMIMFRRIDRDTFRMLLVPIKAVSSSYEVGPALQMVLAPHQMALPFNKVGKLETEEIMRWWRESNGTMGIYRLLGGVFWWWRYDGSRKTNKYWFKVLWMGGSGATAADRPARETERPYIMALDDWRAGRVSFEFRDLFVGGKRGKNLPTRGLLIEVKDRGLACISERCRKWTDELGGR